MKRTKKKGFTIVELTIVIAVIAILAAVLIPTFSSVVDKANQSADIQLIRQANVVLQAATADGSSLTKAKAEEELKSNSITLGEPSQSDCVFYYLESENRYVIFNTKTKKATYPEDLAQELSKKNWLPTYELTYDYGINRKFEKSTNYNNNGFDRIDTGFTIDWREDFTISMKFSIEEELENGTGKFGHLFGSYGGSGHLISAGIWKYDKTQNEATLHVSVNGLNNNQFEQRIPYDTGKKITLVFSWNAKAKTFNITVTPEGGEPKDFTGDFGTGLTLNETSKSVCIGTRDNRTGFHPFAAIQIDSFKITTQYRYGDPVTNPTSSGNKAGTATWDKNLGTMPAADTTITATWNN